ncbi:hypothetical protein [Sodalis sp. dw_96]|uniref:hypothetical protein n=1 Tax=Sodalis sp. dw_96 TaxID=2719794 RepID=UPI001BD53943|nr:hypothetical protein [Sodalis sp. dw_96]
MPSLIDTAIRQAEKRLQLSGKQEILTDGEKRVIGWPAVVPKPILKRAGMVKWDKFVTAMHLKVSA